MTASVETAANTRTLWQQELAHDNPRSRVSHNPSLARALSLPALPSCPTPLSRARSLLALPSRLTPSPSRRRALQDILQTESSEVMQALRGRAERAARESAEVLNALKEESAEVLRSVKEKVFLPSYVQWRSAFRAIVETRR